MAKSMYEIIKKQNGEHFAAVKSQDMLRWDHVESPDKIIKMEIID